ncbi:hypothetical protein B9Z55_021314 [Caenorhabditis nigoni]|uniref:NR LBD domain-containing protein n=1 Tax=Caenorhabditis nigoni TaxID=1611254 RepID=A0A2G5TRJ7_9PELO|nr:hypothetical protein B9Z55_021314 [Caenorhabditis nigoni]
MFKKPKKCSKNQKCDFLKNQYFTCKQCRLQKCFQVGMSYENFQLGWDSRSSIKCREISIPQTIDTFTGKSNLIIFQSGPPKNNPKNFLDFHSLIDKTGEILKQGPESPIFSKNRLSKLAIFLSPILDHNQSMNSTSSKYGKDEALAQLEHAVLLATKWLTHFDEFRLLSPDLQLKMILAAWSVWWKLEKLAYTALEIRRNFDENEIKRKIQDSIIFQYDSSRIDMSWLSKYSVEELKFFLEITTEIRLDPLLRSMIDLNPSEVELSFMLGQLCFHYVGKRFQGEILKISEKFQEILADDLHDYYVNEMKKSNYGSRMAQMMRINNQIQMDLVRRKSKTQLALVFDIFTIDVSHPEMFLEFDN